MAGSLYTNFACFAGVVASSAVGAVGLGVGAHAAARSLGGGAGQLALTFGTENAGFAGVVASAAVVAVSF